MAFITVANNRLNSKRSILVRNRTRLGRLLFLVILPILLFFHHGWPEESYLDFSLDSIGYALVIAGVFVRLWCTLYIGGRKDSELQTSGPYSIVRHPLYFGSLLIGLGISSASENPIILAAVTVYFFIQYTATIRHEESALTGIFGDAYTEYKQKVPCLIPKMMAFNFSPPETINLRPLQREVIRGALALSLLPLLNLIALLHERGVLPFIKFF